MKRITTWLIAALLLPFKGMAQGVWMMVADNTVELKIEQTQTETRPGWKIVDIKMKDKQIRYLWGGKATQMADDSSPTLLIYPNQQQTLTDYVLVKLKERKNYRQLRKPILQDNDYMRFVPEHFHIRPAAGIGFACRPKVPLPKGEYVIAYLPQKPIGKEGDYQVYAFSVRKED